MLALDGFKYLRFLLGQEEEGSGTDGPLVTSGTTEAVFTEIFTELLSTELVLEEKTTLTGASSSSSTVSASVADVSVTSLDLTSSVEYIFDQTTTAVFSVIIENVGTKDIEEATSGDNFEVSFVASSDPDPTTADTVLNLPSSDNSYNAFDIQLAAGDSQTFSQFEISVNVASSDCSDYSYICVQVSATSNANYTDGDTTNNFACLSFGAYAEGLAGFYQCADVEVIGLEVTNPSSLQLDLDVDNIVTYTVRLQNSGPFGINSQIPTISYEAESSLSSNLDASIVSGGTVSITTLNVYVNIPSSSCEYFDMICVTYLRWLELTIQIMIPATTSSACSLEKSRKGTQGFCPVLVSILMYKATPHQYQRKVCYSEPL
ncbi:hypothetical protein BSL78_23129 [Apostichopus japonicus]|uniref:Uncharacterized protein n=1 Tax=Stichopus japonicus TaxID=307972 RepID=A0A2G8JWI2_STIJA|nr:hypothetical protein BSL78_23129 [Apostichopus japonicus]